MESSERALTWPAERGELGEMSVPRHLELPELVVVCGSREFAYPSLVAEYVRALPPGTMVVAGGAAGPDTLAVWVAEQHGLDWIEVPAEWDDLDAEGAVIKTRRDGSRYNVLAGYARNEEMVEMAAGAMRGRVAAFWNGKSKGTRHTIKCAYEQRVRLEIIFERRLG